MTMKKFFPWFSIFSLVLLSWTTMAWSEQPEEIQILSKKVVEYSKEVLQPLFPGCDISKESIAETDRSQFRITCGEEILELNPHFVPNLAKYKNWLVPKLEEYWFFSKVVPRPDIPFERKRAGVKAVGETKQVVYLWLPKGFDDKGKTSKQVADLAKFTDSTILWRRGLYDSSGVIFDGTTSKLRNGLFMQ